MAGGDVAAARHARTANRQQCCDSERPSECCRCGQALAAGAATARRRNIRGRRAWRHRLRRLHGRLRGGQAVGPGARIPLHHGAWRFGTQPHSAHNRHARLPARRAVVSRIAGPALHGEEVRRRAGRRRARRGHDCVREGLAVGGGAGTARPNAVAGPAARRLQLRCCHLCLRRVYAVASCRPPAPFHAAAAGLAHSCQPECCDERLCVCRRGFWKILERPGCHQQGSDGAADNEQDAEGWADAHGDHLQHRHPRLPVVGGLGPHAAAAQGDAETRYAAWCGQLLLDHGYPPAAWPRSALQSAAEIHGKVWRGCQNLRGAKRHDLGGCPGWRLEARTLAARRVFPALHAARRFLLQHSDSRLPGGGCLGDGAGTAVEDARRKC
mmetsp:Transcript_18628/g.58538  ORF Transcript_18628/g.58538 Transcript_18628/m.58538 type:complete len:383 (+) Transcript_18628:167-1315(+)